MGYYFFTVFHTKEIIDQAGMMAKSGTDSAFKAMNKAIAQEADKNTPETKKQKTKKLTPEKKTPVKKPHNQH